jgi:hypothetical protein
VVDVAGLVPAAAVAMLGSFQIRPNLNDFSQRRNRRLTRAVAVMEGKLTLYPNMRSILSWLAGKGARVVNQVDGGQRRTLPHPAGYARNPRLA